MRIRLDIPDASVPLLSELIAVANESGENNTHGQLTIASLAAMLLEDCTMVITRPGSWEGNNMAQVLTSHGYLP